MPETLQALNKWINTKLALDPFKSLAANQFNYLQIITISRIKSKYCDCWPSQPAAKSNQIKKKKTKTISLLLSYSKISIVDELLLVAIRAENHHANYTSHATCEPHALTSHSDMLSHASHQPSVCVRICRMELREEKRKNAQAILLTMCDVCLCSKSHESSQHVRKLSVLLFFLFTFSCWLDLTTACQSCYCWWTWKTTNWTS